MTYAQARASGDGSLISRYVRMELLFACANGQQHPTVYSADLVGRLLVQFDSAYPRSVRCFRT